MASAGPITGFTRRGSSSSLSEAEHEPFHGVPVGVGRVAWRDEETLVFEVDATAGGFDVIEEALAFGPVDDVVLLHQLDAAGEALGDAGSPFEVVDRNDVQFRRAARW